MGNWLYALGMDVKNGRSENGFPMLEKLESCLSKVEKFDWILNWALKPFMLDWHKLVSYNIQVRESSL